MVSSSMFIDVYPKLDFTWRPGNYLIARQYVTDKIFSFIIVSANESDERIGPGVLVKIYLSICIVHRWGIGGQANRRGQ